MSCAEARALLEPSPLALARAGEGDDGVLEPAEAARLEAHLAGCAACRADADRLAGAYAEITRGAEETRTMEPLPDDMKDRILAARRAGAAAPASPPPPPKKGKPGEAAPAVDPARVDAVGRQIALTCAYCHDRTTREEVLFCAACLAPHHRDCFRDHGRCSLPGCDETRTVRPQEEAAGPPAPPRGRGAIAAIAAAALTGLAAAAVTAALMADGPSSGGGAAPPPPSVAEVVDPPRAEPAGDDPIEEEGDEGAPTGPPELLDPVRIDIDVEDAGLADVMEQIGRLVDRNVLVDPSVQERVTVSLREIPWRDAVDVIARMTRCDVEERPGGILILTQPPRVTIQFSDANVRTVLQLLAAYSGKTIVLGPGVGDQAVTTDFREVHWHEALDTLARTAGLAVTTLGDHILVTAEPLPADLVAAARDARPHWREPEADEAQPAGPPPEAMAPPPAGRTTRIDLDVEELDLTDVMEQIGRQVGRNILVDPSVEERVTVSLRDVPWRDAVDVIARMTRCDVEERPGGILLLTQPPEVTLQASRAPARAWFGLLASYAGWNTVVSGDVQGAITVGLKEVHYLDAIYLTALAYRVEVERSGDSLSFTRHPGAAEWLAERPGPEPTEREQRLTALVDEIGRLARAGDTDELEARQAELAVLVAGEEPADPRPAPEPVEAALEDLFERIVALAERREVERIHEEVDGLEARLRAYAGTSSSPERRAAKLSELLGQLDGELGGELGELALAIRLQVFITRGNTLLQGIQAAIRDERYADASALSGEVAELVAEMEAEEREVFHRNAEALRVRAVDLSERAAELARAARFPLLVTAIVVADDVYDGPAAIVDGRVVREGDVLVDPDTQEEIEGLEVAKIARSTVTFRLDGFEFTRELAQ